MLNREVFFGSIRPMFHGGSLNQSQVDGVNVLLDTWEAHYATRTPITQLAYVLATPFLETDQKMQPIDEYGNYAYFEKMYGCNGRNGARARLMGNVRPGDGAKYHGRGFSQLTWFDNYSKATKKLQAMGVLNGSQSLTQTPDLAKDPHIAAFILFEGMEDGWFTGVDLDETIDPEIDGDEFADFLKGRRIINGSDRAQIIAGNAVHFLEALKGAIQ